MHTFRSKAKAAQAAKVKALGGSSDRKCYAFGGIVDGGMGSQSANQPSRSAGKKSGQTVVNVVVAPSAPQEPQMPPMGPPPGARPPIPPPQPPPMPPAGGPGGPPGGPPMGPPPGMGGPGGPPPGMMRPPGMRTGGRIGYKSGGAVKDKMCRADGGSVKKKVGDDPVAKHLSGKAVEKGIGAIGHGVGAGTFGGIAAIDPDPISKTLAGGLAIGHGALAKIRNDERREFSGAAQKFRDTGLPGRPSLNPEENSGMVKRASGGSVLKKIKASQNKKPNFMAGGRVKLDASPGSGIGRLEVGKATKKK